MHGKVESARNEAEQRQSETILTVVAVPRHSKVWVRIMFDINVTANHDICAAKSEQQFWGEYSAATS